MASPSCYYLCHSENQKLASPALKKSTTLCSPPASFLMTSDTYCPKKQLHTRHCTMCKSFRELALERWWYCGPRVRGAGRGSAGDPALPGWGKSGRGQSHLLLLCRLVWWLTGLSTFRLHFCFVTVDEFIG